MNYPLTVILLFLSLLSVTMTHQTSLAAVNFFSENKFTKDGIDWCQEEKPRYDIIGEPDWIKHHRYSIESRVCANLYSDPIWNYNGEDRTQKLIERSKYYVELEIKESQEESKTGRIDTSPASALNIPVWIKNNAMWWSDGAISDIEFVRGMEYLINQDILEIPQKASNPYPAGSNTSHIPDWIKKNAKWWSKDMISDQDFVNGIQYLISANIIRIDVAPTKTMTLTSSFSNYAKMPQEHTCDGNNVSPPLEINNIPKQAKSIAIIMDDPDAPNVTFVHWLLWNIPAQNTEIPKDANLDAPHGKNDFGDIGYGGPCPPSGVHRYFIKAYALESFLDLEPGSTKEELENAAKNRIIDKAELVGRYSR